MSDKVREILSKVSIRAPHFAEGDVQIGQHTANDILLALEKGKLRIVDEELFVDAVRMRCLETSGVDNWTYYEDAFDQYDIIYKDMASKL